MPNAVLASVVFLIGLRLIDIKGMREIARLRPGEFAVAAITAAVVVIVGVEQGIILAMLLSIVEHIDHSYHPHDRLIVDRPDGPRHDVARSPTAPRRPRASPIYRFGASIYYANSAGSPRRSSSSSRSPIAEAALAGRLAWSRSVTSTSRARTPSTSSCPSSQRNGVTLALVRRRRRPPCAAQGLRPDRRHRRGPTSSRRRPTRSPRTARRTAGAAGTQRRHPAASAEAAVVEDPAPVQDADGDQHPEGG